jgi:site-specific recombinase XerC
LDCLRSLGDDRWALHVPLGKLHTERLVPVDEDTRQIISRILVLRAQAPASQRDKSARWLLPRFGGYWSLYLSLRYAAIHAGERAGCSQRVIPHRLRHYAPSRTMPPPPRADDCWPWQTRRSAHVRVTTMRHSPGDRITTP